MSEHIFNYLLPSSLLPMISISLALATACGSIQGWPQGEGANVAGAQGPAALHTPYHLQNSNLKITNFSLSARPQSYPFYAL